MPAEYRRVSVVKMGLPWCPYFAPLEFVSQQGVVDTSQMQDGRVQVGMNLPPWVCRVFGRWAVRTQPALPVRLMLLTGT
jgi:hypothetical protein